MENDSDQQPAATPPPLARPLKIGYIIPSCSVSGGMAVICQHGNRLLQRGHAVVFLSVVEIQPMGWFPGQRVPVHDAHTWAGELDVVVATGWSTAFWLPRIQAASKCYFVQSDETRFHPEGSVWQHLATLTYYFGVHYLTEARWIKAWLKDNFGHEAALVPNGLDAEIFAPAQPLREKTARPRILLEGAIGLPYKGMREAFEAVSPLDVEVWCVSSYGRPEPHWKCHRFFEQVPMREMKNIYSSCDILLKLSRVEGFFGPPMEMMACGGAVVVGRVTGYDEYIVEGQNALVVDALDVAGARAAVQQLIDDADLRQRLIAAGQQTARDWDWEGSIDTLEAFYTGLASTTQAPALPGRVANRRAHYDRTLSYISDTLTKAAPLLEAMAAREKAAQAEQPDNGPVPPAPVSPVDTALLDIAGQFRSLPPHVLRLAGMVVPSRPFRWLASTLRLPYRHLRQLRTALATLRHRVRN